MMEETIRELFSPLLYLLLGRVKVTQLATTAGKVFISCEKMFRKLITNVLKYSGRKYFSPKNSLYGNF